MNRVTTRGQALATRSLTSHLDSRPHRSHSLSSVCRGNTRALRNNLKELRTQLDLDNILPYQFLEQRTTRSISKRRFGPRILRIAFQLDGYSVQWTISSATG